MPVKRRAGKARLAMKPELRPKAVRLLQLHNDHCDAIRDGTEDFYRDGRHEELVSLLPEVTMPLSIEPWEDLAERLRAELAGA